MTIAVSVIVPVYNRENLIGETLEFLLRQTRAPSEILVVDDRSDDGTVREVQKFSSRVKLIVASSNRGPGAARNLGLSQATGTHVLFFDSDDLASADYIDGRAQVVEGSGADLVYGSWTPVVLKDGVCHHDGIVRQARAVRGDPVSAFLRSWTLLLQNCLISRNVVLEAGGYPEDIMTGEDMLLLFRMLRRTKRLGFAPGPLLLLRQHPSGQISANPEGVASRLQDDLTMTGRVLEESVGVDRSSLAAWRARRASILLRVRQDGVELEQGFPLSLIDRVSGRWWGVSRRLESGLSARIFGHRVSAIFEPGPITDMQLDAIQALGYKTQISTN